MGFFQRLMTAPGTGAARAAGAQVSGIANNLKSIYEQGYANPNTPWHQSQIGQAHAGLWNDYLRASQLGMHNLANAGMAQSSMAPQAQNSFMNNYLTQNRQLDTNDLAWQEQQRAQALQGLYNVAGMYGNQQQAALATPNPWAGIGGAIGGIAGAFSPIKIKW